MTNVLVDRLKVAVVASFLLASFACPALADVSAIKFGVNKNMDARLMMPDGPGPYPAMLLLHTSGGLQGGDIAYAGRLVAEGYVVLVPEFLDAYGIKWATRYLSFTTYAQPIYEDFVACLEFLKSSTKVNGKKVGAIGFSNGGYFALWLAATGEVQAGVSYYGALSGSGTDRSLNRFHQVVSAKSSPMLILHGTNDSTAPVYKAVELASMLDESKVPYEFYQYEGVEHSFERRAGTFDEAAATDAWKRTQTFLRRLLKN